MADLSFYTQRYGLATEIEAFAHFVGTLQNYYDHSYYVNWQTVFRNVNQYEAELALLNTLCNKPDTEAAACDLLLRYPEVIKALPALIGCRGGVSIVESAAPFKAIPFDFKPHSGDAHAEAQRYAHFLAASGLVELLRRIHSVPDYATGVEVGMDSNGRKNRSGDCATKVVKPLLEAAAQYAEAGIKAEATHGFLCDVGFCLPPSLKCIRWDWALWTKGHGAAPRLLLVELNHYGTSGSKPGKTALEYIARQKMLDDAGINYIWITDGLGWHKMKQPLQEAWHNVAHLCTIQMAADGFLEWNVCRMLGQTTPLSLLTD